MSILTKSLVACGLIAVSASAMASSNLHLYGRVDTAVESVKTGQARTSGINSSGSHFGFKGEESLGQGLKAGFMLESAFNSDNGSSSGDAFFGSRSELYLSGSLGTVRMGRFLSPSYYTVADRASLHNEDYGITADALYAFVGNDSNRIAYASPEMNGLTLESSVSLHEDAAGSKQKNTYDLAANYDLGDWSFGAGYSEHGDAKQGGVRATWSADALTLSGYVQRSTLAGNSTNVVRAAAAYAIGGGELHANYGYANGQADASAHQWTVGYNHILSKRTKLYAFYTQVQNKNGAAFAVDNANDDVKAVSVGIRHTF